MFQGKSMSIRNLLLPAALHGLISPLIVEQRYILMLAFIAITALQLRAQDEGRTYLDGGLASTTKKNAKFFLIGEGKRDDLFIGRLYSIDGKLRSEGTYRDEALRVEHGAFIFYHPNGQIESRGEYILGNKSGVWERFDSTGKALAENIYDHQPLLNIIYTLAETMPTHGHKNNKEFSKFVKQHVKPQKGKRLKGEILTSVVVEKDGNLSEVKIIKGQNGPVDQQVIEAIKATAPWNPGSDKGQPVRVMMRVPVQF